MAEDNVSYTRHTLRGFGWLSGGAVLQSVLQITTLSVLARLLHPADFGIVNVAMILVGFSTIFVDIGIGASLVQLQNITPKHVYNGYIISIILGIVIGGIFFLCAPLFAIYFKIQSATQVVRVFALYFPIRCFGIVPESLLQRNLQFKTTVSIQNISYLIGFGIISISCAYLGFGYWSLIYAQFGQLLISTTLLCYKQRISFKEKFDLKLSKSLMFEGGGYSLATIFNFLAENGDNMVVGRMLGAVQLGLYGRAFQLFALPARFFGIIFDKLFFPILSRKRDDQATMDRLYMSSLVMCHFVVIPIAALLIILAPEVVTLLLGHGWEEIILPFQILAVSLSCRFGTKINKSFIKSLGIVYKGAVYQFGFCVMIVAFTVVGAYKGGLVGVAIGVLLANLINYIQTVLLIVRTIKSNFLYAVRIHLVAILLFAVLTFAIIAFVFMQRHFIHHYLWIIIISIIVICPIALVLVLFLSKKFLTVDYLFIKQKISFSNRLITSIKTFFTR